ncbi:MAG TPA: hypothetical protein VND93_28815 [Myxococcales bacterium]|nr:hypothetical protein [Myxococcales bacterium]
MRMRRIAMTCMGAAALLLGGCASMRAAPRGPLGQAQPLGWPVVAGANPGQEQVCTLEVPTGSHLPREVCRTRAELDREREQAEELLYLGFRRGEIIIY